MDMNIKIVGLGEGGARALGKMLENGVGAGQAEFVAIGNDENIMLAAPVRKNIFLNRDPTTIYKNISEALRGANLVIMVGGLGSNAARIAIPTIISCAKNIGAVTIAFMCKPSVLEKLPRKINAEYTLDNLRGKVDTLIAVPAEKFFVFRINQPQISLRETFEVANEIFCRGVEIFLEMAATSDLNLALFKWGNATFGYGKGDSAEKAIKSAAKFPLLDENDLKNAEAVFVRLVSGNPLPQNSIDAANKFITDQMKSDAEFFSREELILSLGEKIFASVILTRKEA